VRPSALELVAPDGPGSAGATLVASGADDTLEVECVLAVKPDRALRRRLQAAGFARGPRLLHVPDVERSRFVFPLGGAEASFALRTVVPSTARERVASRVLGLVPLPVGPTSTVFTRGRAPFEWLGRLEPPQPRCTAVIARAWRPSGASVLYRFAGGREPDVVVKLGGGSGAEVEALDLLRADAVAAGARLPEVRQRSEVDRLTLVVQTPVDGVPAPRALAGDREAARRLLDDIATWLEAWAERTARPRELAAEDAKRLVLGPASALAPLLGAAALDRLEGLCEAAAGRPIPFVVAHNDLTAANVLLARGAPPGVVDWEHAAADALPLTDLTYACADAAAAVDGYRDRPAAYDACFAGGSFADTTSKLLRRAAARAGLDEPLVDLCLAACWVRHAANEHDEGATERPFLTLLSRFVRGLA
jgi:hypothetical protein